MYGAKLRMRIADQPDCNAVAQVAQKMAQQGRFARTDFAGQQAKLRLRLHRIFQHGQRRRVLAGRVQKAGIRIHRERLRREMKILLVHGFAYPYPESKSAALLSTVPSMGVLRSSSMQRSKSSRRVARSAITTSPHSTNG